MIADTITRQFGLLGKTRQTPSGWISGNAPCCHHRGTTQDTRGRGGILLTEDNGFCYSCFNCGFKVNWSPGNPISFRIRQLLEWMNMSSDQIYQLSLAAMKLNPQTNQYPSVELEFPTVEIPLHFNLLENCQFIQPNEYKIAEFMAKRGLFLEDYPFFYSAKLNSKLIIPYYFQGRCVGYTLRSVDNQIPKYIKHLPKGIVFNLDNQLYSHKFAILTEGEIDAIHLNGIALGGSTVSKTQAQLISNLNKTIVVLPDRDNAGKKLIDFALEYNWAVSFPIWELNINDANDAVLYYGRLYTIYSILNSIELNPLKIQLKAKTWFNI